MHDWLVATVAIGLGVVFRALYLIAMFGPAELRKIRGKNGN